MKRTVWLAPMAVVLLVVGMVGWAARSPMGRVANPPVAAAASDLGDIVTQVNGFFQTRWNHEHLAPAEPADELQVLRRLSLSLHGTLPSLEEIRHFEADKQPNRLGRWTARILADSRFADYMAERLARSYVGTHEGQFIIYRRDRFTGWLREQLRENRPYDEMVREMVTKWGLSEQLGPLTYSEDEGEVFLGRSVTQHKHVSDDTAKTIDEEIRSIIDHNYERARNLLESHLDILHLMAEALIKYETIDSDQIDTIMAGNKPQPPKDWSDDDNGTVVTTDAGEGLGGKNKPDAGIGGPASEH